MATYTIIAAERNHPTRPCWMLDAASSEAALTKAWILVRSGHMPWLSSNAILSVRRSSKIERAKLAELIAVKPAVGIESSPDDANRRSERLARSFFRKLWRDQA